MAKKVKAVVKLQIPAGKATPAPPIGPALGQHGISIKEFCDKFNSQTRDKGDVLVPVVITIYEDRSFTFITKTPPTSFLIKKAAGVEKGSGEPNRRKVGKITLDQVREIAQIKLPDMNANDIEAAMRMVMGTARNMGVEVIEQ